MKKTISDLDGFAEICNEVNLLETIGGSCDGIIPAIIDIIIDPPTGPTGPSSGK